LPSAFGPVRTSGNNWGLVILEEGEEEEEEEEE
jgi:hypothetical protein